MGSACTSKYRGGRFAFAESWEEKNRPARAGRPFLLWILRSVGQGDYGRSWIRLLSTGSAGGSFWNEGDELARNICTDRVFGRSRHYGSN